MVKLSKVMSDDEYETAIKELFNEVDSNNDNALQQDEFKQFMIAVAKASGTPEVTLEALRAKSDSHWV